MVEPLYPLRCLLAQAAQHLWLVNFDDVYQEFTCVHHTAHPAPSPPDAGRDTVPSRFGRQSGDCGYLVRGHLTARYLAAVPAIPAHGLLSSTRDGNGTNCSDFIPHFGLMRIEL